MANSQAHNETDKQALSHILDEGYFRHTVPSFTSGRYRTYVPSSAPWMLFVSSLFHCLFPYDLCVFFFFLYGCFLVLFIYLIIVGFAGSVASWTSLLSFFWLPVVFFYLSSFFIFLHLSHGRPGQEQCSRWGRLS